jgi:hypothetical protein
VVAVPPAPAVAVPLAFAVAVVVTHSRQQDARRESDGPGQPARDRLL